MIHNKKQLASAVKEIKDLQMRIEEIKESTSISDIFQICAWENRQKDLKLDIDEFNSLLCKSILTFSKENFEKLIIFLRIASGMSQRQLADAIDVKEQQIQRYEQTNYLTASFERIIQIIRVLSINVKLEVEVEKIEGKTRFNHLTDSNPNIQKAMEIVRKRQQILVA